MRILAMQCESLENPHKSYVVRKGKSYSMRIHKIHEDYIVIHTASQLSGKVCESFKNPL